MKPFLRTKLLCDDKTLFTHGACHIFADELATRLVPLGFVLKRLADINRCSPQQQALHVFLSRADKMVDVNGIQYVAGYVQAKRQDWLDLDGPRSNFQVLDCSQPELFKKIPSEADEERGARNKWHLLIDDDFVAECRERARALLILTPRVYGLG